MKEPSPEDIMRQKQAVKDLIAGKANYSAPSGWERLKRRGRTRESESEKYVMTHINADSMEKLFFDVLYENWPEFGISLEQLHNKEKRVENTLMVKGTLKKTDEQSINRILAIPVIHAFTSILRHVALDLDYNNFKKPPAPIDLEKEGKLDPGTTLRVIAWHLELLAKTMEGLGQTKQANHIRNGIKMIGTPTPLDEPEIKALFKKAIEEEL